MKKTSLLLTSLAITFVTFSQRIETNVAIEISKKILLDTLQERIFNYFVFENDNGSFYELGDKQKGSGYVPTRSLLQGRRLKNGWTEIWVRYDFNYPELPGIRSGAWVKLNKDLRLVEPIQLDFIPQFIWNNEASNFITLEAAHQIASKNPKDTTLGRSMPYLAYDNNLKRYVYTVTNTLTELIGKNGRKIGMMEILRLDAESGKIIEKTTTGYGIYIR